MKDSNLLMWSQYLIVSIAFSCIIIAFVTILLGVNNFFQNSPYPFLGLVLFFLGALLKLENSNNHIKQNTSQNTGNQQVNQL